MHVFTRCPQQAHMENRRTISQSTSVSESDQNSPKQMQKNKKLFVCPTGSQRGNLITVQVTALLSMGGLVEDLLDCTNEAAGQEQSHRHSTNQPFLERSPST